MTIEISLAMTGKPRVETSLSFPALAAMVRMFRARRADRETMRQLDAVPRATLRDIGITRPEVFAGIHSHLSAA